MKVSLLEGWYILRGTIYTKKFYLSSSEIWCDKRGGLIREVAFGERGLIREVAFSERGLIRSGF